MKLTFQEDSGEMIQVPENLEDVKKVYKPLKEFSIILSSYGIVLNAHIFKNIEIKTKLGEIEICEAYIGRIINTSLADFCKDLVEKGYITKQV